MRGGHYGAEGLSSDPLEAAAEFHDRVLPDILQMLTEHDEIQLMFEAADHRHREWQSSAVAALARKAAPKRVNAIVGGTVEQIKATQAYLRKAPGVTGQIFTLAAKL
ncbi:Rossmann fold domain-containing protein [Aurantiacibacter sediminis]|uniref:Short chain dehydrogenase-like proteobacteria domain-containing protein n=1 Tax=Aurantiacibacter sediminis TaxID=2793064 RepID=A0ABS0N298_9SPHN|nr:hypothetical protein [Aurantiacibacter sediminis]MBH5322088.1 hypothetical protein [Aurantiacibacter sediminis]